MSELDPNAVEAVAEAPVSAEVATEVKPVADATVADPVVPAPEPVVEVPVVPEPIVPEPVVDAASTESLPVDVTFDAVQLGLITEAGLEPAQVRNEIGLVKIKKTEPVLPEDSGITLTEAIKRAVAKYKG